METISGAAPGRNIAFHRWRYYLVVGTGWKAPATNALSRPQLMAAAGAAVYRVHGNAGR